LNEGDHEVTAKLDSLLKQSPDPEVATLRLEHLLQEDVLRRCINKMSEDTLAGFIHLISISNFLYHFLCREPDSIVCLDKASQNIADIDNVSDVKALRLYKYQHLLGISGQDLMGNTPYEQILNSLSLLADKIINKALEFVLSGQAHDRSSPLCIFALGKLGAVELNYSSDVDLIFVCANEDDIDGDVHEYQTRIIDQIRKLSNILEETTEDGFLYRVDLKLRPWGRSGPLVLSIDDTEHYYEASNEAWERFAWLRARKLAGDEAIGSELLDRLQPFIFHQSLGSDDLERFIQIKNDMAKMRKRTEYWNVKLGEGGIRDIEFFVQMLQIVNACRFPKLQITNTLSVLQELIHVGLLQAEDGQAIHSSYLFFRRLENRLQMVDERQTHELPDDPDLRLKIARSLGYGSNNDDESLQRFDKYLGQCRDIASSCFERILPGELSL
jgi:glutamate-ammonia-ligase adenylyltransferase